VLVVANLAACREPGDTSNGAADPAEILAYDGTPKRFACLLETFNAKAGGKLGPFGPPDP
jgi:hypothetical protein